MAVAGVSDEQVLGFGAGEALVWDPGREVAIVHVLS